MTLRSRYLSRTHKRIATILLVRHIYSGYDKQNSQENCNLLRRRIARFERAAGAELTRELQHRCVMGLKPYLKLFLTRRTHKRIATDARGRERLGSLVGAELTRELQPKTDTALTTSNRFFRHAELTRELQLTFSTGIFIFESILAELTRELQRSNAGTSPPDAARLEGRTHKRIATKKLSCNDIQKKLKTTRTHKRNATCWYRF